MHCPTTLPDARCPRGDPGQSLPNGSRGRRCNRRPRRFSRSHGPPAPGSFLYARSNGKWNALSRLASLSFGLHVAKAATSRLPIRDAIPSFQQFGGFLKIGMSLFSQIIWPSEGLDRGVECFCKAGEDIGIVCHACSDGNAEASMHIRTRGGNLKSHHCRQSSDAQACGRSMAWCGSQPLAASRQAFVALKRAC